MFKLPIENRTQSLLPSYLGFFFSNAKISKNRKNCPVSKCSILNSFYYRNWMKKIWRKNVPPGSSFFLNFHYDYL
jgi:hypothetical protein